MALILGVYFMTIPCIDEGVYFLPILNPVHDSYTGYCFCVYRVSANKRDTEKLLKSAVNKYDTWDQV